MKWITVAFGIFVIAIANSIENAQAQVLSVEDAEREAAIVLNFTRKVHHEQQRINETIDILRNNIWPSLRSEIFAKFTEQKQKLLSQFTASKTDVATCDQFFKDKANGIVANAEKVLKDTIDAKYKKLTSTISSINVQDIDDMEEYLSDEEAHKLVIEACTSESSGYLSCNLHYDYYPKVTRESGVLRTMVKEMYQYTDELRKAIMSSMNSLFEKVDTKVIRQEVHKALVDCMLTL